MKLQSLSKQSRCIVGPAKGLTHEHAPLIRSMGRVPSQPPSTDTEPELSAAAKHATAPVPAITTVAVFFSACVHPHWLHVQLVGVSVGRAGAVASVVQSPLAVQVTSGELRT